MAWQGVRALTHARAHKPEGSPRAQRRDDEIDDGRAPTLSGRWHAMRVVPPPRLGSLDGIQIDKASRVGASCPPPTGRSSSPGLRRKWLVAAKIYAAPSLCKARALTGLRVPTTPLRNLDACRTLVAGKQ